MDAGFARAQAAYDAMEPPDPDELPEPTPVDLQLEMIANHLAAAGGFFDESADVHRLSDRQATVGIWIDGHEYSLTLNKED
jgi:hypothetical protein